MTDTRNNHPHDPMEDEVLDRHLASLGRFAPGPGFEDRVMARVRVGAQVAAAAPGAVPAVRRRRWPVVAWPLTGVAALSSTALTAWLAFNFETLAAWATAGIVSAAVPAWHAVLAWLAAASASGSAALVRGAFGVGLQPLMIAFVLMNLAVPVSLYGLYKVARPAVRMRSHAAR
jgi:hypothetical protein